MVDGEFRSGDAFQTLDEAAQAADTSIRNHYPKGHRADGVVQYVINPWAYEGRSVAVFFITGPPGDLAGGDISRESGLRVHGRTLEELVGDASMLLGPRPKATFRWSRELSFVLDAD